MSAEESTGMNPKKKLEVEICAPLIHKLCDKYNKSHPNISEDDSNEIKLIIDIGAGLGYLSRILARKYGYKVIGLENREDVVSKSNKNNEKNIKFVKEGSFHSYCLNLTSETTCNDIEEIIKSEFGKIIPYIIIGLHCCGDLSVYIINLFFHQVDNNCKGFFFLGCCYNLLNNFPLSIKYKNISLNYHQKNIACQLLLNSSAITPEEKILSIKTLYYRSLFQIHLKSINHLAYQYPQNFKISKIKPEYTDSFLHYFKFCVNKLKIDCPSDDYINNLESQYKFKDFVIYYSLRNSLTDVFESIIIIDRIEYIKSVTNNVEYIPIFPINISPRNIAIMTTL